MYTELTATSFVAKSVFCLRKPEAIEKTTPKPNIPIPRTNIPLFSEKLA